ncbi:amidohydrolase family protein [Pedobacter sp. AW1-32]|uniref:amidohydrolase family protein n=1 Tax=Pedobacter sp. AW1-32 TaxID=3383026 RepID=UPI003FEF8C5E
MRKIAYILTFTVAAALCLSACKSTSEKQTESATLLTHLTLIDGNGGEPVQNAMILIQGDTIAAIGTNLDSNNVNIVDLGGKTVLPTLISAHVHIGALKGTETKPEFYTRENILRQLKQYMDYGVGNVMVMGTDRPMLFESGLRDSSAIGELSGARIHSAGYGFGVKDGGPPVEFAMDRVFRPTHPNEVPAKFDSLQKVKPEIVKMWVDDFLGDRKKMDRDVYKAIINEAHKRNLRVAAHVYYLSDAQQLVADGVDLFGHSIRDKVIDDALVAAMKLKNVAYIPTLSLDEFAYIYASKPVWINDPFFKNSLEPGVYEMITSDKFQQDLKNSPKFAINVKAFDTALINLKKLFDAGILVAMGTDSGAMPIRAQGFSEHLELELLVQAGLTPLEAITVGTKNAAKVLNIDKRFGTIEKGKIADLLIVDQNPTDDIKNTRKIFAVYKSGKEVSKGPLNKQ